MANVKISEMEEASQVTSDDYIPIIQQGVNKKAKVKLLKKSEILWTNPNPTEPFNPQAIILNSNDYDVLEWFYISTINGGESEMVTAKCIKGFYPKLGQFYCGASGIVSRDRNATRNSDTSYQIGEGRYCATGTTARTTDNNVIIPLYVIGHKTGLFN